MELIGKLSEKKDAVKRTETFTVREFVLEVQSNNSQYTDYVLFQLTNDRCGLLDQFNTGDELHVTFDIRGRKWTSPQGEERVFNTLSAWRIEKYDPARMQQGAMQGGGQAGGYMPNQGFQQPGYQQPMGGYQPYQPNGGYQQPQTPQAQQPQAAAQAAPAQPQAQPEAAGNDGDLPF